MKCSVCGSEKLFEMSIINSNILRTEGSVKQSVISYACEECGHIELYATQEMINKHRETVKLEEEREIKLENLKKKLASVNEDIDRLEAIIVDENQTVKTVNEAKSKLNELKKELRDLQQELASGNSKYTMYGRCW